jgi:putative selenium metabolism protein SsnA
MPASFNPQSALWVRNARVLTFDKANRVIDDGAVRLVDGAFDWVGPASKARIAAGEKVFDAGGRLMMPALINCHTHLYSTLARGLHLPGKPPASFLDILKKLWWRLDRALDADDVYSSALAGLVDSARCGVGTVVDHHSSPHACPGSLDLIARACEEVGLRGCLCYETSDRNGVAKTNEALAENARFLKELRARPRPLLRAGFGLHASFTLGERTVRRAVEAARALDCGFHIHVAEDRCDVADARRRFRRSPVARLVAAGVLGPRSLAAHCVHVTAADIRALARHGVNVIHNPQSNCNNAVGTAPLLEMTKAGVLVGLGSDGYTANLWEEFKTAFHLQKLRTADPRVAYAEAYAIALLNNREILRKIWGLELGRIQAGSLADFILVDYDPPTPLDSGNLFGHLLFGIADARVSRLAVHGRWVVADGRCVNVDEAAIAERARRQAKQLWKRMGHR